MSWKKVKLGQFLKVRDNRFKPNDKAIADLKRIDKIDFSGEIFISDKPSNTDMILIKKGDLVISGINVEKGAMAVYTGEEDITATIHYSSYSFDENTTDIEFLKSFLKSIEFKNALKEQVPGGIKTEIKPKHLLPLIVEIPTDIKDQREVVKLLQSRNTKVDAISSEVNHQLDLVKKLRQQLLQDAVQGKLVEQNKKDEPASELLKKIKAEKEKLIAEKKIKKEKEKLIVNQEDVPFELPKNWSWCNLGELAILNARIGWKGLNASEYKKEGPLFLSVHSLNYGDYVDYSQAFHISQERYDESPEIMLKDNDILICKDGAGIGKLGIIKDLKEQATTNSSLLVIRCFNNLNVKFIYYYLISGHFQNIVQARIMGATTPHLYQRDLVHFYVALPPLAEQNRIVQKVEELMQYCNELETSIKQSETQNEKLLQQVLREALRKEPVEA